MINEVYFHSNMQINPRELFKKAIDADKTGRRLHAQSCYQFGNLKLTNIAATHDDDMKCACEAFINVFGERAGQICNSLKEHVDKAAYIHKLYITDGATNQSYGRILGRYLNSRIKEIVIVEMELFEKTHFENLIKFLETIFQKCSDVKYIRIVTRPEFNFQEKQVEGLSQIDKNVGDRISLEIKLDQSISENKIILGNGYILRSTRGLHFYKQPKPYSLGLTDYDFRECYKTEIDVYYSTKLYE